MTNALGLGGRGFEDSELEPGEDDTKGLDADLASLSLPPGHPLQTLIDKIPEIVREALKPGAEDKPKEEVPPAA